MTKKPNLQHFQFCVLGFLWGFLFSLFYDKKNDSKSVFQQGQEMKVNCVHYAPKEV
jgi:hypothetical protein